METFFSRHIKKHPPSAWLALSLWLLISTWLCYLLFTTVHNKVNQRFNYEASYVAQAISERMRDYELALRSGKGLFDASTQVTRTDWRHFVDTIQLQRDFPGIQAIGYAEMIPSQSLTQHIQSIREEGFPDYTLEPTGKREQYSSIVFIEPFDWRNQRAFGVDMFSEPVRRQAMILARDTKQAVATGPVILEQETNEEKQHGFLMYVPVYQHNKATGSVVERRDAIQGFVYAAFRMKDFMQGILGRGQQTLNFEIYDFSDDAYTLLYKNADTEHAFYHVKENEKAFSHMFELNVGERNWRLFVYSHDELMTLSERYQPILIAIICTLVGVAIFSFISFLARQGAGATKQASEAHASRNLSEQRLLMATRIAKIGVMEWDLYSDKVYMDQQLLSIYKIKNNTFDGSYKQWLLMVHELDRDRISMDLEQASQFEERFELTFRIFTQHGIRYLHGSFYVERDAIDNPSKIIGFIVDKTVGQEAHTQLRQEAERLETVLSSAKLGSWQWNIETGEAVYNQNWAEMIGYDLTELLPMTMDTWKEHCHPDDVLNVEKQLERHLKGETDFFECTIRMLHRNGKVVHVLTKGRSITHTQAGQPLLMFGIHQQIS
ncbi:MULTISPECIES: CHASE domain-containing protein [unclassified Methylophaga]|jgi:PAS domain S-box-containing protein|uniref:CHASE domain-containing protein n=1 Tax=unclassified Methylophaga TaxID=2629249 RepID=UPI00259CFC56|nr:MULTISPECIES: CHASE domain-containing protein [unclassified Methylophaga]|tara:strand:- start:59 stop:1876 length:1818 start_codon:yes stop_codon:yes gene_type:complete